MSSRAEERAAQLRAEADAILGGRGLSKALAKYGRLVVHGSHALGLLVWRDLDIYLCVDWNVLDLRNFFELGAETAAVLGVHRMHFRDERVIRSEGLPAGLYWGAYLPDGPLGAWKIDLWAVDSTELDRLMSYQQRVAKALTPELREIILDLKMAFHAHPEYRRGFGAKDIYDAVLDSGVRSATAFGALLKQRTGLEINV